MDVFRSSRYSFGYKSYVNWTDSIKLDSAPQKLDGVVLSIPGLAGHSMIVLSGEATLGGLRSVSLAVLRLATLTGIDLE